MAQVTVSDTLMKEARACTSLPTTEAIVEEALRDYITQMKAQAEWLQYQGKLLWDAEWAGEVANGVAR
ncbi:hypothetical protein FACS1894139_16260 [Planctomycetales bacterium]|nr:hypothetical protein FACS1894107_10730 [Planctomycetales bacterium]GHS99563.1 hypothetical protein FACS1894108_09790 [Planctomycetales bacterium]GHT07640.1 hypothetical protein FACS1894139_16260 [Planctomycetales bacterium]